MHVSCGQTCTHDRNVVYVDDSTDIRVCRRTCTRLIESLSSMRPHPSLRISTHSRFLHTAGAAIDSGKLRRVHVPDSRGAVGRVPVHRCGCVRATLHARLYVCVYVGVSMCMYVYRRCN